MLEEIAEKRDSLKLRSDLVHFSSCLLKFTTHAINGLSDNDFICAAKVDKLLL